VLGFPCNQFGSQEPASNADIKAFACEKCPKKPFPIFSKIDVNGENASPLYAFLTKKLGRGFPLGDNVLWNFEKFLVTRSGKPVRRFLPTESGKILDETIVKLLEN